MKTFVAAIQKGGQGKSMLCTHVAIYAAQQGLRVLAVDLDGQGTFSRNLCAQYDTQQAPTLELFLGNAPKGIAVTQASISAPGCIGLLSGDKQLTAIDETPEVDAGTLRVALKAYESDYDFCVIDPPPTLGKRLRAALIAADYVVMPFVPARESVDGLADLFDTIEAVKRQSNPKLHVMGLLANKTNSRSHGEAKILADIKSSAPGMLLKMQIHERTSIAGAMAESRPVWQSVNGASHKLAAAEMRQACQHIVNTVFKKK